MFIGHFGLGFGAKRLAPEVSLGTLFLACQLADLLWPTLVLLGVERVDIEPGATAMTPLNFVSYPYSHSLLALCVWGFAFGAVYAVVHRSRLVAAVSLAVLVISHWVLDAVAHRPDMPLTFTGTTRVGLDFWSSVPWTMGIELAILAVGMTAYMRATTARDRIGSIGLASLVAFLLLAYFTAALGPPPPSSTAVAWSAEAMWILVVWAYWVDRHRLRR